MALVLANRVQELATANTTVSFTLTGAVQGFQSFSAVGNGNTTYYSATDGSGNWEVGLGTYSTTGPTLTRTTVYASSNSGSAVTFSGAVNVFVTYPSGKSVNLDATGNVSALGTVASGTWQGSTVGVAYGGTGVTASSGANSVMLRDANQNVAVNRLNQSNTDTVAAGGTTTLTAASSYSQTLTGTGNQTYKMPDATTLTTGVAFVFNNNATGTLTLTDYASATIGTITSGGAAELVLLANGTVGGTWDVHGFLPENVTWGTNALNLGSTVISNGTWQGGTIQSGYGGTGLTTFTGANNALYSTSASALTAGTLPVAAGGTGVTTTPTNGQLLIGNGTNYTVASLGSGTGISTSTGAGTLTINNTGVTSLAGTSPVTASASTGSVTVSLASGYGDTQNPYASKTANYFLAAPNGTAGAPIFRAIVAADIPTLNQNTTGSAGSVANAVTFNNGGAGGASGSTFNGSGALTVSYNTVGAPSTTGTNASGTWGINITGTVNSLTLGLGGGSVSTNVAVGNSALASNTTATNNTAVGYQAGYNTTGSYNDFFGYSAGSSVTSGSENTAIGRYSMGQSAGITGSKNVAVGTAALTLLTSGNGNTAVGYTALQYNTTASNNTAVGYQSLYSNTTGYQNTAVGDSSLYSNTTGYQNTAVGYQALYNVAGNTYATALGFQAGYQNGGSASVSIGYSSNLFNNGTGSIAIGSGANPGASYNTISTNYSIAIGYQAMGNVGYLKGSNQIAIGYQAAYNNYIGSINISIGSYAGYYDYYGNNNIRIGQNSGYNAYNATGSVCLGVSSGYNASNYDVAIGAYTLDSGSTGSQGYSTAVGVEAGGNNATSYLVAIGAYALLNNTSGTGNTALGANAAYSNTTGSNNTAIGREALYNNTTTSSQTAVGYQAMYYMRGGTNTASGYQAMYGSTTAANNTGYDNVADGYQALFSVTSGYRNNAYGYQALYSLTTGAQNVAIGWQALWNHQTGNSYTAVGFQSQSNMRSSVGNNTSFGFQSILGSGTVANNTGYANCGIGSSTIYSLTSGNNNAAFGNAALYSVTSASRNTAVGNNCLANVSTGSDNVAVGYNAGYTNSASSSTNAITTGSTNIYIGNYAYPSGVAVTREIVIGYDTTGKGSNTGFINPNGGGVYQGNNSTTWSTTSDVRIKENFVPVTDGLAVINALEPFEFDYILTGKHDVGFKAQQYMTVLPEQITKHAASDEEKALVGESEIYGIQRNLDPYLVSAIKSLTEQVKALQQEIAQLKGA